MAAKRRRITKEIEAEAFSGFGIRDLGESVDLTALTAATVSTPMMASASSRGDGGGHNTKGAPGRASGSGSGGATPSRASASNPAAGDADMDKQTKQLLKLPVTTVATKLRTKSMKGYTEMLTAAQKAQQAAKDCTAYRDLLKAELPEPGDGSGEAGEHGGPESSEALDLADRPLLRQIKERFAILSALSDTAQTKIDTKKMEPVLKQLSQDGLGLLGLDQYYSEIFPDGQETQPKLMTIGNVQFLRSVQISLVKKAEQCLQIHQQAVDGIDFLKNLAKNLLTDVSQFKAFVEADRKAKEEEEKIAKCFGFG
ncbi:unnamed protein product [Symbiodinium sp. CCMP2592]|nr:unnamed protein product [Symbiodinium sp. CCMP2592]